MFVREICLFYVLLFSLIDGCRYLYLDSRNISKLTIDCSYFGCYYADFYIIDSQELSLKCRTSHSCSNTQLYTNNAITYDSLYCNPYISTSCQSFQSLCSYPSISKQCTMQYDSTLDIWTCEGDICIYDNHCINYSGLQLIPNYGSVLGGDTIIVIGPCYDPNINYTCKFGIEETELFIINNTHGYCISPPTVQSGSILFAVHEDNEWYGMISTFYYNNLYYDYGLTITPQIQTLYNVYQPSLEKFCHSQSELAFYVIFLLA